MAAEYIKNWGSLVPLYEHDKCHIDIGRARLAGKTSWHTHKEKNQVLVCLKGKILVRVEGYPDHILSAGDGYGLAKGVYHQLFFLADSEFVEVYWGEWADREDIVRTEPAEVTT